MLPAGEELQSIGDTFLEGRTPARAGLLFDWNNWWALELASGPSKDMDYLKTVSLYYETLYRQNIPVDILPYGADLSSYDLILAPMLYMEKEKRCGTPPGICKKRRHPDHDSDVRPGG